MKAIRERPIRTSSLFCLLFCLASGVGFASEVIVVGSLSREVTLQPGGKNEGRIILRNTGDSPREVKLYQTDYMFSADGASEYGDPGSVARSNASWVTFTPRQVTVPGNETYSVYYTIEVPDDPSLTGTYWSMLMVEPLAAEDFAVSPPAEDEQARIGVRTVLRYGIQFVTSIADTGTREMRFADRQLVATEDGARVLRLDIENSGERWLRPLVWAELYDKDGAYIGRFDAERSRLFPGCSARFKVDLSQVPRGVYQALIVADNGDDSVFGAQYQLNVE
jgi:hypothetical protein